MIAELKAIQARINALPALAGRKLSAHVGQVPTGTALPYASITGPSHDVGDELSLNGSCGVIDSDQVRVKVVADTENNARVWLKAIRDDLSPGEAESVLDVAGRHAVIVWARAEAVYADRDSTLPNKQHPVVGVETYRIVSQPDPSYVPQAEESSSSSGDQSSSS